jgi:hypothetical protein
MVTGHPGGIQHGVRGGGVMPPAASTREGYNPQGEEKFI